MTQNKTKIRIARVLGANRIIKLPNLKFGSPLAWLHQSKVLSSNKTHKTNSSK